MITLTVVVTLAISGGAMLTGSYLIMRWIFASDRVKNCCKTGEISGWQEDRRRTQR
jgi:hypothetical protein